MSLTFHLLVRALTVERTVDRPLGVARCTIIILRSDDHFEHLVRYLTISNLATLSTLLPPLVAFFTTAHDICMWKRCQNSVAGGGSGVICMLHTTTPLPVTKCPLFHKLTPYEVGRLLFYRRNMLIE